jgi:hypothetical protein
MEIIQQYGLIETLSSSTFQDTRLPIVKEGIFSWKSGVLVKHDGLDPR